MNIEQIAKVAYEVNRAYCQAIGDDSQPPWEEAADWQKDTNIEGVKAHLANPTLTPEDSHLAWMNKKAADGWTFGVKKDTEKKEHPCMLPFSALPVELKAKDHLFGAVVRQLSPWADIATGGGPG